MREREGVMRERREDERKGGEMRGRDGRVGERKGEKCR